MFTNRWPPQKNGAASFTRVLDGAHCPGPRARRAPNGGLGQPALGSCVWAAAASKDCAARPERGGLGVAGRGELQLACASRREAPRAIATPNELEQRKSVGWERAA